MAKKLDKIIKVRKLDEVKEVEIHTLPVVFQGTRQQCNKYASEQRWTWKRDANVFGGYWTDASGNCYYPTI